MQRFPDWPERLVAYVAEREAQRFEWGKDKQDCCSFANGGVIAMTGVDLMADLPDYASAEEADLILATTSLEELMDARLPRRESPAFAQRGDVGLALIKDQPTLVLVEGTTIAGPNMRTLAHLPRSMLTIAWAV